MNYELRFTIYGFWNFEFLMSNDELRFGIWELRELEAEQNRQQR